MGQESANEPMDYCLHIGRLDGAGGLCRIIVERR